MMIGSLFLVMMVGFCGLFGFVLAVAAVHYLWGIRYQLERQNALLSQVLTGRVSAPLAIPADLAAPTFKMLQ